MSLNVAKAPGNDYFLTKELLIALLVLLVTVGKCRRKHSVRTIIIYNLHFFQCFSFCGKKAVRQTATCYSWVCVIRAKPPSSHTWRITNQYNHIHLKWKTLASLKARRYVVECQCTLNTTYNHSPNCIYLLLFRTCYA